MVRTFARLLAIVVMVMPLTTCIFVLSVFPATLSQIVARADLAETIPAESASEYRPCIVTPTGGEFVILLGQNTFTDPAAVIMDSDLEVIQTYTPTQLTGWGITGGQLFLMKDAIGTVVLKDHFFTATDLRTVNQGPSGLTIALNDPSFSSLAAGRNDINFNAGGNFLSYEQYTAGWGPDFSSVPLQINVSGGSYNVEAVYNVDDAPAAGKVVIVFIDQDNPSNLTIVAIPLVDILNNVVFQPLLSNYPYKSLTNIDSGSIGFAGDCIVAYAGDSQTFNRYSPAPPFSLIDKLAVAKKNQRLQYAYRMTGGYSVIYDEESRTLTKVANWW